MGKRALSPRELLAIKDRVFPFTGKWLDLFGTPARTGVWFIWGNSGSGKSDFVMQLTKALAEFERVLYDSLEEGTTETIRRTARRHNLPDVNGRWGILDCEPMDDLHERLLKPKQPRIILIDSFQYTQLTYKAYLKFKEAHRDKLIIFISHADGTSPAGRSARSVMYDAALKIWVQGYRAFSKGRFIGPTGQFDIWPEAAERYWGERTLKP